MKKRAISLFLIFCICLSLSVGAFADTAELANPVQTMKDFDELVKAQPDIKINDAPEDAENVRYTWIDSDPVISQIDFQLDGREYTYRAALCPDDDSVTDISGVYTKFPKVVAHKVESENKIGGSAVLSFNAESGEGLVNWDVSALGCQYSLYVNSGCTGKVDKMPIIQLLDSLYLSTDSADTVKATVVSFNDVRLVVTLENGDTVVLLRSDIEKLAVEEDDVVEIVYTGDLEGDAKALKVTVVGAADKASEEDTFSGRVFRYADPDLFVATVDNNVFLFKTSSSTKISGKSSKLEANAEVTVSYTGDLYETPNAVAVEVTKAGKKVSSTPAAAPGKNYVDRTVSGYITSVAFPFITVGGMAFYIDTNVCAIYGDPTTSNQATVQYRDYGFGHDIVATVVSFYSEKTPKPDYDLKSANGMVYGFSGLGGVLNIEFIDYTVPYDCYIIGKHTPECYADIRYNAYYDGRRVATQIEFYEPYRPDYVEEGADGTVYGYNGSSINVDGVVYTIGPDCYVTGSFTSKCRATVIFNHYNDGRRIATRIEFYQPYTPQVVSVGEVTGAVYGYDGSSINVEGMSCSLEPNCSVIGSFSPQCRASVCYNVYDNGAIKASSIEFMMFVGPVLPPESAVGVTE